MVTKEFDENELDKSIEETTKKADESIEELATKVDKELAESEKEWKI